MDGEGKIVSTHQRRAARARGHVGLRASTRTEPKTSPEELLAAAHASCFAMQLASRAGRRRLGARTAITVTRKVAFELGIGITDIHARSRRSTVDGLTDDEILRRSPSAPRRRARSRRALAGVDDHARAARPRPADDEDEADEAERRRRRPRSTRVLSEARRPPVPAVAAAYPGPAMAGLRRD